MHKNRSVTQQEQRFSPGVKLISATDLKGVITHCNDAFESISGFTRDELIGQHHNIVRHPDMPKAAFKGMWDTIQSGKTWYGYVKNLCKNGSYYWVYATVVPSFDQDGKIIAYTSIRRMPSPEKVKEAEELYKTL